MRNGALVPGEGLFLGAGGHADGAVEAGAKAVCATSKGISSYEIGKKLFWANDSMSLNTRLSPEEIKAVQDALRKAFPGHTIEQVITITDAYKK